MICDTRFSNEAVLETLGCMVIIIPPHHPSAGMAVVVKNPPASAADMGSVLGWEDPLEEGMEIHSSILAWTQVPGGLQTGHKE